MNKIYITGGAGFIGAVITGYLNQQGINNIIIVDELDETSKRKNLINKKILDYYDKKNFLYLVENNKIIEKNDIVIHMGACSSTIESDSGYLMENNTKYSQSLYNRCKQIGARLIYASSAATYGNGSRGYSDYVKELYPLNMYGYSKYLFDQWVIRDTNDFSKNIGDNGFQVVGVKFFNVYGPDEYHKARMASMIYHGYNQIIENDRVKLFKSHRPDFEDGEQKRDFVYVKDVAKVIDFFINNPNINGIFNVGTGTARSFNDLIKSIFKALDKTENIEYIDMPDDLKGKYQYFTEADINKLKEVGYKEIFFTLEDGVKDYVQNYLDKSYQIF